MNWSRSSVNATSLVILLFMSGCYGSQPKTQPVYGLVRFPDGKLLRNGSIEFELLDETNSVTATAEIMPDGTFTLGTFARDDGALPGKHRVAVFADVEVGNGVERPGLIAKTKLHPKYREFRTSGLQFEVKPGKNNFIVKVDYAPVEQTENSDSN